MSLLYEAQTKLLRRCFFDVQNDIGLGWGEEAYHRGCERWLSKKDVQFQSRPFVPLNLRGEFVLNLIPDLVAFDSIVIELKARRDKLQPSALVQLFDYLKLRGDRLGLLVNMGLDRVDVQRVVYDPKPLVQCEDWARWDGSIHGEDRSVGMEIRKALRAIVDEHGVGYGNTVTKKLVSFAIRQQGLNVVESPVARSYYDDQCVGESMLDCLVVENRILIVSSALFDSNSINIAWALSFMKALQLEWGVAVNFGRSGFEVMGLYRAT